jgi:hypothetical protein
MSTYLISTQYLEDYEVRFKPKGGRSFVVDAPCYYTALALVQRFLFTEQHALVNEYKAKNQTLIPSCEFPILEANPVEYLNASHAIMEIPEYERDENIRLIFVSNS